MRNIVGRLHQASTAEAIYTLACTEGIPMPMNDNDPSTREATFPSSDAHGQAALLLVESLIHGLCENSTLTNDQAVEITERAIEVQFDKAEEADGAAAPLWRSHSLLLSISASLKIDCGGPPAQPHLV